MILRVFRLWSSEEEVAADDASTRMSESKTVVDILMGWDGMDGWIAVTSVGGGGYGRPVSGCESD
jgi:hypothetical protein